MKFRKKISNGNLREIPRNVSLPPSYEKITNQTPFPVINLINLNHILKSLSFPSLVSYYW